MYIVFGIDGVPTINVAPGQGLRVSNFNPVANQRRASAVTISTPLDVDLAEQVSAELVNRHRIHVVAWPVVESVAKQGGKLNEVATKMGAERSFLIAVRVEASGTRVTAFLMDIPSDRKMHVSDLQGQDLTSFEQRKLVAITIADDVAKALR